MQKHYFYLFLFLSFQSVFAWNKTGHRIVGQIASNYLTKNTKQQIRKLLGHQDLSRISNWADEVKSDSNWTHAYDWHYCTIPEGEKYISGKYKGEAVEKTIEFGLRTKDISTDLDEPVGTKEMAKQIIKEYKKL